VWCVERDVSGSGVQNLAFQDFADLLGILTLLGREYIDLEQVRDSAVLARRNQKLPGLSEDEFGEGGDAVDVEFFHQALPVGAHSVDGKVE